jgi:hypothetical protein
MCCQVWKMRTGSRLLTIPCPKGSRILQPSARLSTQSFSSSYSPLEVYLFNGDSGQLSVLNRHVGWIICSFVVLLSCYCQVLYRNTCFVIVFTILLIKKYKKGVWVRIKQAKTRRTQKQKLRNQQRADEKTGSRHEQVRGRTKKEIMALFRLQIFSTLATVAFCLFLTNIVQSWTN